MVLNKLQQVWTDFTLLTFPLSFLYASPLIFCQVLFFEAQNVCVGLPWTWSDYKYFELDCTVVTVTCWLNNAYTVTSERQFGPN